MKLAYFVRKADGLFHTADMVHFYPDTLIFPTSFTYAPDASGTKELNVIPVSVKFYYPAANLHNYRIIDVHAQITHENVKVDCDFELRIDRAWECASIMWASTSIDRSKIRSITFQFVQIREMDELALTMDHFDNETAFTRMYANAGTYVYDLTHRDQPVIDLPVEKRPKNETTFIPFEWIKDRVDESGESIKLKTGDKSKFDPEKFLLTEVNVSLLESPDDVRSGKQGRDFAYDIGTFMKPTIRRKGIYAHTIELDSLCIPEDESNPYSKQISKRAIVTFVISKTSDGELFMDIRYHLFNTDELIDGNPTSIDGTTILVVNSVKGKLQI